MALERGYKVVMLMNGRLMSCYAGFIDRDASIAYGFNKWTAKDDCSGSLAVFTNYKDADRFLRLHWSEGANYARNWELHHCIYLPSDDEYPSIRIGNKTLRSPPRGTGFADGVMLVADEEAHTEYDVEHYE